MVGNGQKYKIRLASGRILGPLDLERIRLLISKNQIVGKETAREHPNGEWVSIGELTPIADLLIARAQGQLDGTAPGEGQTQQLTRPYVVPGTTRMLPPQTPSKPDLPIPDLPTGSITEKKTRGSGRLRKRKRKGSRSRVPEPGTPTTLRSPVPGQDGTAAGGEATWVGHLPGRPAAAGGLPAGDSNQWADQKAFSIAQQPTMLMSSPHNAAQVSLQDAVEDPRKARHALANILRKGKKQVVGALATLAVLYLVFELLSGPNGPDGVAERAGDLRPSLPAFTHEQRDPGKSGSIFVDAMRYYVMDTVPAYKLAAEKFKLAAQADISNVKALALLASCYLNLIDSSSKDENYFGVITQLIGLSAKKDVDLPESVIADVEFYLTINKAEKAQNRIDDYTKTHSRFGTEMFYYLALALFERGDFNAASRYIANLPEAKIFSPKVYYLRGQIFEKFQDYSGAIREYEKAIKFYVNHARSRLAIARIYQASNRLQDAAGQLEFLVKHPTLLSPIDLANAYFLHAQLKESTGEYQEALNDMERAVKLVPSRHPYLLELYSLRARTSGDIDKLKPTARMYYYLSEGEKLLQDSNTDDALAQFLQARQVSPDSPLPLVKIGDMYYRMHDFVNARLNYRAAAQLVPNNVDIWSKYIDVLIQSYEWDEAKAAMDRFRKLPVNQSAIDKAAADMYAKQQMFEEAERYYKKAMSRDAIDPGVYYAYAKTLLAERNYKEAPLYFALALRIDPLNVEALVGTARCVAATEGIDNAINMLQDALQKGNRARAELFAAIAEFLIQKGAYAQAEEYTRQSMLANPDYAGVWKLKAQLFLTRENTDKTSLDRALDAYNSYSDRNPSDPTGYLERYKIFVKKAEFERASDELGKVFAIYPKYPNLHLFKGNLYSLMGNHRHAIEEYKSELQNNPNSVATLISYGKELIVAQQPSDALTNFNRAMVLAPRSAEAKFWSGYANYLLKNYQGAIALYQTALSLEKGNPMIYKRLGQAYRVLGDAANAASAFREYLRVEPDAPDKAEILQYLR